MRRRIDPKPRQARPGRRAARGSCKGRRIESQTRQHRSQYWMCTKKDQLEQTHNSPLGRKRRFASKTFSSLIQADRSKSGEDHRLHGKLSVPHSPGERGIGLLYYQAHLHRRRQTTSTGFGQHQRHDRRDNPVNVIMLKPVNREGIFFKPYQANPLARESHSLLSRFKIPILATRHNVETSKSHFLRPLQDHCELPCLIAITNTNLLASGFL